MRQLDLFRDRMNQFERLCSIEELSEGFKAVKQNGGNPGIDGVTIKEFDERKVEELKKLSEELKEWKYEPKAVKRVKIPKPGKRDEYRLLGIPCVRDRVVQATIKHILEPELDPTFSRSSYGFRPGKSQRHAVEAAQEIVIKGKEYVVDIDLSKFFDRVNQDRLIGRLRKHHIDKRILRLIGMTLRSGVMEEGLITPTLEGTTQGSPLSPILSNVVLDELDKELERRGLEFCRYADDCNIFLKSEKAAERVMKSISKFIEKKLKLTINQEKSKVAKSDRVKFLGMTIVNKTRVISAKSMQRAMDKIKELTPRNTHEPIEKTIEKLNNWYKGWATYYNMTQYPAQLGKLEAHIRRRLRARIIRQQKKRKHLFKKLIKRKVPAKLAAVVYKSIGIWALSRKSALEKGYPNQWFIKIMGQAIESTKALPHWFDLKCWINVT